MTIPTYYKGPSMIPFYPFMYDQESHHKDEFEQLPLYIDEQIPNIIPQENEEEPSVVIIDVF